MSRRPPSSKAKLKRDVAIFSIILVVVAAVLHVALPWFDVGSILGLLGDHLIIPAAILGFLALAYIVAAVDDHFTT